MGQNDLIFKHILIIFSKYCDINSLKINYIKSKVLVFEKSYKPQSWHLDGDKLEQVKDFIYSIGR